MKLYRHSYLLLPYPAIKQDHSSTTYRPDIDGLRMIAVGIVVIFHAWPEVLTGGFVGVDVFFLLFRAISLRRFLSRKIIRGHSLTMGFIIVGSREFTLH